MDLGRLRFGDWVMGIGGIAVLAVMFLDWYEVPSVVSANAWESFAITDLILALAATMAIAAFVITALQPTAAVPLALSSLTALVALVALVLVVTRLIWPPDFFEGLPDVDVDRVAGAWLGLVAVGTLAAGCLASIRDERLPEPEHPVEPRLVEP